jgi:hypothetical protein
MRFDFTPRRLFAPTPEEAAKLNQEVERLIDLYQKVDGYSYLQAQRMADTAKQSGTVTSEVRKLTKELQDSLFASDYLFRSFQEQTAELMNQNNTLKIGKSLFNELTDIAQKLTNFQKGYGDINEKGFKKLQNSLKFQIDNNQKVIDDLEKSEGYRKAQIENLKRIEEREGKLTRVQKQRLDTLRKEQDLYEAALDAQKNGVPLLEKELSLSKQIYKTREDLGGLTKAAASVIQQFGGSLAQYLDISEAIEAVDEYNKKVIDAALEEDSVRKQLNRIEEEKIQLQQDVLDSLDLSSQLLDTIKTKQLELNKLTQLSASTQALSNLPLESSVSILTQKKDLVQSVLGSLDLEQSKQEEIINKINRQIALQQEAEQNASRLTEIEQEKINLSTALADGSLTQQQHDERRNALSREEADINVRNIGLSRELAQASMGVNDILRDGSELHTKINDKLSVQASLQGEIRNLTNEQDFAKQNAQQKEIGLADALMNKEKEAYNIKEKAIKATSTGLTGFINKFKSLGVLIDNLNFTKVLTDPVTLMTTLVNIGFKANSQAVELGKSFGISAKEAGKMRGEMAEFARNTGDTFINTDRLLKAQSELSKELGIAVKFSNEELATFSKLTELTGLSAQEAGKLAQASAAAGIPTQDYTDSIREAAFFAQQTTGTHFDSKEILQDVSKLSAGILVKFQGNPKAIGQAVVEAKKLGLTLDQIDKIGESLLNWESSIENELKAELMTGKQLNLERARAAALSGDQLTLTREISSQVGSLNDFQNMNVLAQKSLADAFGLSRDEMAEMLMKQEAINKYGKEAADLNKDQLQALKDSGLSAKEFLAKQEQQRTAQAKFQDAMVKLQTIIANLVDGPVGDLLDALADIVGSAMNILKVFEPLFKLISFAAKQLGDFAGTDLGKLVLSIGAITLFLPKIASGLGLAYKGVMGLGSGLLSVFKADTWSSWGKGLQSVFSKDKFTGFFSSLKDKFLESAGLSKKLKEGLTDTVTGTATDKAKEVVAGAGEKVVEAGEESLTDKLKDKATETIEGKVEDKAGELKDKIMGSAEEGEIEYEEVEEGSDGSKFKEKMKNVAAGIKAFGDGKVILGGLIGLPASAVGLIAMLPGVLGIKAIEQTDGKKVKSSLKGLADGIAAFGEGKVTGGALNLIVASIGLTAMLPGVLGAKAIEQIDGKKFQKSIEGIANGISSMGTLTVTGGAANLIAASIGLVAMIPGVAGAKLIELINGPKFAKSMIGLSTGLSSMATLTVTGGAANLIAASIGLIAMIPGVVGARLIELINGPKFAKSMIGLSTGLSSMATLTVTSGAANLIAASIGLIAMIPGVAGAKLIELVNGPKFTKSMIGLSTGLSTMSNLAVTGGAANLIAASIGLIAMIPGIAGAKLIELINGPKFTASMIGLSTGLSSMTLLTVTGGAANLIAASVGLIAMVPGVAGAKLIELINGPKFTASMIGLATGLSTMALLTVTEGAANLIAASIGLIAMIPGIAGAKIIESINGPKFTASMVGLAAGLSAMGISTVTGGAANLILSSLGLIAMIPGILGAVAIQNFINGPKFTASMIGLAAGLSAMGTPTAVLGALALIPAAVGLTAMIAGAAGGALLGIAGPLIQAGLTSLSVGLTTFGTAAMNPMVWAGIGLLAAFNLALLPLGYTLNLIAPAIEAFGNVISKVFSGIATVITSAANGIATMFNSLQNVDVAKLLAIGPALVSIGIGLASLGAGGVISAIGAFLGGDPIKKIEQLAASGDGLQKVSTALQTTNAAITQLNASLASLDVSKLDTIGPAITKIGIGLASLGAGNMVGALSSLLAGDPIEKLERLAATSDGLQKTATALQSIANALSGIPAALNNIDLSKINKLKESPEIPTISNISNESEVDNSENLGDDKPSIFKGITDFFASPIKTINEPISKNTNKEETINTGIDLTPMIKAINEVRASVDKLYNKETSIKMDGKSVGSTMVKNSSKMA